MSQVSRNFFLILLVLFISSSPAIAGVFGLIDEHEIPNDGFFVIDYLPVTWFSMPVLQKLVLLGFGIFIFALFVMYLGGRLKNKRFNDRTIDPVDSLIAILSKAALDKAAFNFLFANSNPGFTKWL